METEKQTIKTGKPKTGQATITMGKTTTQALTFDEVMKKIQKGEVDASDPAAQNMIATYKAYRDSSQIANNLAKMGYQKMDEGKKIRHHRAGTGAVKATGVPGHRYNPE